MRFALSQPGTPGLSPATAAAPADPLLFLALAADAAALFCAAEGLVAPFLGGSAPGTGLLPAGVRSSD